MKIKVLLVAALALVATSRGTLDADAIDAVTSSAPGGEKEKPASQVLRLYLTAIEAYDRWKTWLTMWEASFKASG